MLGDTMHERERPQPLLDRLAHMWRRTSSPLQPQPTLSCPGPQGNNPEAAKALGRAA